MENSTQEQIRKVVEKMKGKTFVFPTDFRGMGSEAAIKMSLSRLVKEDKLERIAHGIYYKPKYDPKFGKLQPSMEEIAQAVAAKDHVRIRLTGVSALNRLGLSTQVPMNSVYLTDGQARQIKIGRRGIKFKAATPKKFAMKGEISSLLILALEELGIKHITPDLRKRIVELIKKENPDNLQHDLKMAAAWVNDFIVELNVKKDQDD